jgi:HSP20 family molecular chaperone IbpA
MRSKSVRKHSRTGEKLEVKAVTANEQERKVQEAVARRAYAIFESRGLESGHELEDWRQAEREVVRPLCGGRMTVDDSLWVGADVAAFETGTVELWIAPRRITVCGKPRQEKLDAIRTRSKPPAEGEKIFRVLDLAFEVDPSQVTAKFNGPELELLLKRAQASPGQMVKAAAA